MKLQRLISLFLGMFSFLVYPVSAQQISFLAISDIHLNDKQNHIMAISPSGYDPRNDMDIQTFLELSSLINRNVGRQKSIPTPKFILYLGDIVGHQKFFDFSRNKFVQENTKKAFKGLMTAFPNIPIINIFGNNDSFEKNYGNFLFDGLSPYKLALQSGFKNGFLSTGTECSLKGKSFFPCVLSQNDNDGFFTIKLADTLMLIGLNSVMFSPNHRVSLEQIQSQMDYLKKQLAFANKENISVLIAMHIPVGNNVYDGSSFWKKSYQKQFLKIISDNDGQVQGILAAHTHMDEFKIIRMPKSQNIGEYFTAGLSTSHGNAPSIKSFIMSHSNKKWSISNYTTYQIHRIHSELSLDKYYDFSEVYCKKPHEVISINSCLGNIKFQDILPRYTVNNPNYPNYKVKSPQSFYVN